MKKISMLLVLLLAMAMGSHRVFAQSVTITLMPGWTWISCPTTDTLDFATAFGSFTPMQGDIIKSQWGQARYTSGLWLGRISQFYPGYGYMYKSNRQTPVMLTFNAQQPEPEVVVTTMEPTDITTNSATCGGNVVSTDGNYVFVILRGICWSTNPNPTFNDNYVEVENSLGSFTASMTELTPNTTYYVRAFAVTANGTFYGNEMSFVTLNIPSGAINGLFSVSETQQVYFSQGNLQYQASTGTWRFAANQWDYVGESNSNISHSYNGWIDLFGWGTSGYNHGAVCYQPYSVSQTPSDYYAYGQWEYHLYDQTGQAEWGYNPIFNGGNQSNQWRTLTYDEWCYVLFNRGTPTGIRFVRARVNDINGIILLPDDWNTSYYNLSSTNSTNSNFSNNTISIYQWNSLEQHGAIFLPVAGRRYGTTYSSGGGFYWSASHSGGEVGACSLGFYDSYTSTNDYYYRYDGRSVRLVQDYNP